MSVSLRDARRLRAPAPGAAPSLADVLAAFNDAVVVTDDASRIVLFNPAAEELTGVPQRRALGAPCDDVFHGSPLFAEMARRVLASGQGESRSEETLRHSRRDVPVRVTCLPLWDRDDRVSGVALVIHDLGYQRMLEDSARRNESLARLGTLVAGLAHEVRNPLAGIKGAAQLLEARLPPRTDLTDYTAVITREVNRLSALVEDLLTLGAPPKPRLAPVNIHRVIQDVVAVAHADLARAGVSVQYAFDPSLPDVQGDDGQLSQVLLNVVRNAIEAMVAPGGSLPTGRLLSIATRMETDFHILRARAGASTFLRVEVADRGGGVAPEVAPHLFEPFFTTKARGTGLGLAISAKIIAEHGGIIRASPNQPSGTVITITLPVAKP
jgi:two-component system nitrogen regulation sensor histidine kinase GlnL